MTTALYVIPDIHGQAKKLDKALSFIPSDAPVVFLGDYVDRGPDSKAVLDRLIDGLQKGQDWILIRGNHDQLMLDALENRQGACRWLSYASGAIETLASYGTTPDEHWHRAIPSSHVELLRETKLWHETEALILAHAGIMPGVPIQLQTAQDLMWIREPFLSDERDHDKLVVHGHTPLDRPRHYGNRVALDGGAGWGRDLHVALFEDRRCWLVNSATERSPLRPA